jgi:hypothetical protein
LFPIIAWIDKQSLLYWSRTFVLQISNLSGKKCILDNFIAHKFEYAITYLEENDIIVKFLPPNLTFLLQQLDLRIISTFKNLMSNHLMNRQQENLNGGVGLLQTRTKEMMCKWAVDLLDEVSE